MGASGVWIDVELADGRRLRGEDVRGVLNRLVAVSPHVLSRAAAADRDYASQELYAFFLSWLAALPGRVANRPSPQGLSGPWLQRSEWLFLADRVGLSITPYRRSSAAEAAWVQPERTVLVVGSKALASRAPREVAAGCGRLARLARTAVLGAEFSLDEHGAWRFAGANPLPDLQRGGDRALDLLAALLGGTQVPA